MNWESDGITRRSALTRGFGGFSSVALVCSFDFDKKARVSGKKTSAYVRSAASTPFEPFQRDVPIMPVATPTAATKQLEQYVITMKPGTANILEGLDTPVLGYNGLYPGPTIKATRGREVQIRQINQITIWSLIILGGALMLGSFSRLAALGAAGLLLLFYLPMPPWPGVPEAPAPSTACS